MWQFNYWNYTLRRKFIDVKTMNIHQRRVILIEKTVKAYSEEVILSLSNLWKHTKIEFLESLTLQILTSCVSCVKRQIFHYLQYKKVINFSRTLDEQRHLLERTMETLICNDTVDNIMKTIDFLRKVKHIRPTTEKIYTSVRKELNNKLDIVKYKTNKYRLFNQ